MFRGHGIDTALYIRMVPKRWNVDVLQARAVHPICGVLAFESATQDRRQYYRMTANGRGTGSLTTERHALETIAYWRSKGWL